MASRTRPEGSLDQLFNKVLLGSLLLHLGVYFLVMTVEPPPPPSQEEYATWLKKVTPPKVVEEVPPKEEPKPEMKEEEQVVEEKAPAKAAPPAARAKAAAGKPGEQARRATVRKQLSGAGVLGVIGEASEGGELANVFESGEVVSKDLGAALSERGGVRVSGGTRIGKKGALGAGVSGDIGEVDAGAGGSAGEVGARESVAPKAFVKGSEAVLPKGGIDEKGVRLALRRRERGIQQCYERALKTNTKLRGKVILEWSINEEGRVVKIRVIENTLGDSNVANCISDIIKRIRFPGATKGIVPVRKTFVFESAS
ncbi:MAG: AgmX/PglI C-terminal domain-containing protein [Myxococcales bacterium]|nr:AgmX/PglI C-terminal domain-containing protein [Myxococcales bacterium]USN50219.1 MAG: AgmX/PglI C-terminal domain-containing protein [Myxococcales bacterium]